MKLKCFVLSIYNIGRTDNTPIKTSSGKKDFILYTYDFWS